MNSNTPATDKFHLSIFFVGAALLVGCTSDHKQTPQQPPLLVKTQAVEHIKYQASNQFIGRIESYDDVMISAQVNGYLHHQHFTDGQLVEKEQLLYEVDDVRYKAAVSAAKANISQAKANLANAEINWKRGTSLLETNAISHAEYDALTAQRLSAKAQLEAANAELQVAEVDLAHTKIKAPFSGRIGRSNVSPGDLVTAGNGALTTLVSLDPIRASFNISEHERLSLGIDKAQHSDKDATSVSLNLGNQTHYDEQGFIDFVGNRIDIQTGTLSLSAQFPNTTHELLPGQFIEVVVTASDAKMTHVVPRRAIQSDLEGEYVLSVNSQKLIERHNVSLGPVVAEGAVILAGLEGHEAIIVSGLQRARPGFTANVIEHSTAAL
ncbi:efflux RND transporter periplasmic adaptor subunit [Echinimonas agarilytica]|uniref:Efflux RND transporter periplasmic adaptor subunit n=1 Tax=Echinimonas agarilytica TaxID=1215918 RepID=A0AA42B8B3_9GAMM|nr:efflux RND transporter periplasmic adaptor subunit [Echinimonas agarilytica]MCM2680288.1 efflux RND transporter periplasmic adaptor subunit [Echinimonas agarilytica]